MAHFSGRFEDKRRENLLEMADNDKAHKDMKVIDSVPSSIAAAVCECHIKLLTWMGLFPGSSISLGV
jgi:hypothetical protein